MKKLLLPFLLATLLMAVYSPLAQAATWTFHGYLSPWPGHLIVQGTIDCVPVEPPLWQGWIPYCTSVSGCVPAWCNDYRTIFTWHPNYGCGNVDTLKVAVPFYDVDHWELHPLNDWLESNLPPEGCPFFPSIGDSTGDVQYVNIVVNLEEWLYDPRPLQDEYYIYNGECPDLPGYMIGTTPIVFDPMAPPEQYPFSTTPLTGFLWLDAEITFDGGPTAVEPSTWGRIKGLFLRVE